MSIRRRPSLTGATGELPDVLTAAATTVLPSRSAVAAANGTRGSFDFRFLYVGPHLFPWWECTYALTKSSRIAGQNYLSLRLQPPDRCGVYSVAPGDIDFF